MWQQSTCAAFLDSRIRCDRTFRDRKEVGRLNFEARDKGFEILQGTSFEILEEKLFGIPYYTRSIRVSNHPNFPEITAASQNGQMLVMSTLTDAPQFGQVCDVIVPG